MLRLSRFLRALPQTCTILAAGATALVSGHAAHATTLNFGIVTPSHQRVQKAFPTPDAFVRVGIPAVSPQAKEQSRGGFTTLLGSTRPAASGFKLAATTDPVIYSFASANYTVGEGDGRVAITVLRSGNTTVSGTVKFQTNTITGNGNATAPGDFTAQSSVLSFGIGETSKTFFISITNDSIKEDDETFTISLNTPTANQTTITPQVGTPGTTTVLIHDDDAIISLDTDTTTVGEGDGNALLTLTRDTGDVSKSATVQYSTQDGTATSPDDYRGTTTGTVTFAAGSYTATISIPIVDDSLDEGDENFTVTISNPSPTNNNTLGATTKETVTIADNDDTTVSFASSAYSVSETGPSIAVRVVRRGDTSRALSVDYTTIGNTAQGAPDDSGDYVNTSGTLNFAAGQTAQTITIPITDDTIAENDETFFVSLDNVVVAGTPAVNGSITPNPTTTVTIVDNDAAFNFATSAYSVNEGAGTVNVVVTRNTDTDVPASVDYTTTDQTATATADYTTTTGTLNFASGDKQKTISIPIIQDQVDEDNETFRVALSNPSAGTQIGPVGTTTVTIIDDDDVPTITVANVSAAEGNMIGGITQQVFTATLSAVSSRPISFVYTTADGTATTANNDYQATTGTVRIQPNTLTATFAVPIIDDSVYESDEGYIVNLTNPTNATLATKKVVGTIVNDDAPPMSEFNFVATSVSTSESNASVQLQVTRVGSTATAASVVLTTADGTATAGEDYSAVTKTLQFPVGTQTVTTTIPILDDSLNEATETFTASLGSATNNGGVAKIGDSGTAVISIADDDPLPTLTVENVKQAEGDNGTTAFVFTAQLDAQSAQTISVNYATSDGSATAGSDYQAASGTLTFAPGETSETITVLVNGDMDTESNETFGLNLSNPQNVKLGTTKAVGTITNDDTPVVISSLAFASGSLKPTVSESVGQVNLVVTRAQGTDRAATVKYATSNITALAGKDYTATSGTLTFAVGQRTASISVPIIEDTLKEDAETFKVTLSNPSSNASLSANDTATVTIRDNEGTPTLSIANTEVVEGNSGRTSLVFTVSLQPQSQNKVTVLASTVDSTADNAASSAAGKGQDYQAKSATLTFNPGESTKTFSVTVLSDTLVEPDETVVVTLTKASGAPVKQARAVGTILNDDQPGGGGTVSFLTPSYSVDESAGIATITIARSGNVDMIDQQTASVRVTSGQGTATPNQDYKPINTVLTFAKGETVKSFNITIGNDTVFENDETVPLTLSDPSNNAILGSTTQATLTITDDDAKSSAPRADSLTPNNPTGLKFVVTATYSSDLGASDLSPVAIQIGGNSAGGGFRAVYDQRTNRLSLDPTAGATSAPKTNRILTNQYGMLDCSGTTVQKDGNTLRVTWSIRLDSSFTKSQSFYLGATGTSGESVFVKRGTWAPGSTPNAFNSANGS